MEYLRPQEVAKKIGTSVSFVRKMLRQSKCREIKKDGEKTLFCYEDIIQHIQQVGK